MNIENLVEFLHWKHDQYLLQGYKARLYQVGYQVNLFECKDLKLAIEFVYKTSITFELELCTSQIYLLRSNIEGEPCTKRLTIYHLDEDNEYYYEEHKEGKMK